MQGLGAAAWVFVCRYGCANGVITIVRGVLPAALFGRERLGGLLGWLARPSFVAQAIAPAAVAGTAHVRLAAGGDRVCVGGDCVGSGVWLWRCALLAAKH